MISLCQYFRHRHREACANYRAGVKHEDPLSRYVATRLKGWMSSDPKHTQAEAARIAKVSQAQISNLLDGSRGAGRKTMKGLAAVLGTTWAQLEAESEEWARKHGSVVTRNPSLTVAIRIAREGGINDAAIDDVVAETPDDEVERPVLHYIERMRHREYILRSQGPPRPPPRPRVKAEPTPVPITQPAATERRRRSR